MLKLKLQYFGHQLTHWKDLGQGKGATEDKMAGRHHQCNGHELAQTPGYGEGQGGLASCSPWGYK